MIDRRSFLAAGSAAAAIPAAKPRRGQLVVNALGGLEDPNDWSESDRSRAVGETERKLVSARILRDARASGLDAINVTLGYVTGDEDPFEQTVREIGVWDWRLKLQSADLTRVLVAADISRARREGRIGIIYGVQNCAMVGDKAERIEAFADLGLRVVQLTYNPANRLGGGATASPRTPLTPLGREVIERCNARRLMVDLSHSGAHLPRGGAGLDPPDLDQPHRLPRPQRRAAQQERRGACAPSPRGAATSASTSCPS
jgi:membrane dipeptidase